MKNIRSYCPEKYNNANYQKIEDNIYKTLYSSIDALVDLKDKEMISILKDLKGWKKEKSFLYSIEYENKKYFILRRDYEAGYMHKILIPQKEEEIYVTSIIFEPEPDLGENDPFDEIISQYPLEDILNKFNCFCTDNYNEENKIDSNNSYQEFGSKRIEDIRKLMVIIGKHVYNKESNGKIELIIE